jgi:hypothetical protein
MAADPAGDRRAARAGAGPRAAQARRDRLGIPDPLHECALAGRADAGHAGRRPVRPRRKRQSAGLGPCRSGVDQRTSSRHCAGPARQRRAARRAPRQDGILVDQRALSGRALRAGDRCGRVRGCCRDDHPHCARDRARRVQRGGRAADKMDRHARTHARQGHRQAGCDARDARHLGALERFPDLPRAAPVADAAGRARRAGTSAPARRIRAGFQCGHCRKTIRR